MQHIDWRTRSLGELSQWSLDRHYQADLSICGGSERDLSHQAHVISDGIISIARAAIVGSVTIRRGHEHIQRDSREGFTIYYPLRRELRAVQNGPEQIAGPGEFFILRGDSPLRLTSLGSKENPVEFLYIKVPTSTLHAVLLDAERFCGHVMPLGNGLGKATRDFMARDVLPLCERNSGVTESMLRKVVELALEASSECIRAFSGKEFEPVSFQQAHLERLRRYIQGNLGDKSLSASSVAAACGISARYLHMVMAQHGTSFSDYLWSERLAQALSWLQSPSYRHFTIQQIASAAGFANSSHFSRAFRNRFGYSPRSVRNVVEGPTVN